MPESWPCGTAGQCRQVCAAALSKQLELRSLGSWRMLTKRNMLTGPIRGRAWLGLYDCVLALILGKVSRASRACRRTQFALSVMWASLLAQAPRSDRWLRTPAHHPWSLASAIPQALQLPSLGVMPSLPRTHPSFCQGLDLDYGRLQSLANSASAFLFHIFLEHGPYLHLTIHTVCPRTRLCTRQVYIYGNATTEYYDDRQPSWTVSQKWLRQEMAVITVTADKL